MARLFKNIVTSDIYKKAVNLKRRLKRQADKIDAQLAEARKHWWTKDGPVPDMVLTLNCDADQQAVQFESQTMARAFIRNRQAGIHGNFNTVPDAIVASDQDEGD